MTPLATAPPPGRELLDDPAADPSAVTESLRNIARSNRWFGGRAAARWGLERVLGPPGAGRIILLDVGTGAGDLPRDAVRWGAQRGHRITPFGVEVNPTAARLATLAGIPSLLASGTALPFATRSVDVVLVSQVTHHLSDADAAALLRECGRVARRGVVLTDLRCSRLAEWGFRLAARVLGFDAHTRADGALSVRRGYTQARLTALLTAAGIPITPVRRRFARFVAAWPTT